MKSVTLRVEKPGSGYRVKLFEGTPWNRGRLLKKADRGAAPDTEQHRTDVLNRTAVPEDVGTELGEFLLAYPIGPAWKLAAGRTYLDVSSSGLENAPWELARVDGAPLFLSEERPFCMYRAGKPDGQKTDWGIRVLIAVTAQDANDRIKIWRELYAVRNAIRGVNRIIDLKQLPFPTRDILQAEINTYKPHVLHVIGEGDDDGLLLFDGNTNWPWTGLQAKTDLERWKWKPELVYLNTCRSAGGNQTTDGEKSQSTIVDHLLDSGIAAVIAMQADIQGNLAGACAGEFYRAIAGGKDIDRAIADGRHSISQIAKGQEDSLEPYLPKLVVTKDVEQILRYQALKELPECPEIKASLDAFVDRHEQRRELVRLLEAGQPVVIIRGPRDVGKTWLLQWCIDAWRRRNMDIRYVPISNCRTWLDVVRAIRDGSARYANYPGCVSRGLSAHQSATLNWRLNKLGQGIPDPPMAEFKGNETEGTDWAGLVSDLPAIIDPHIRAMGILHAVLQAEAPKPAQPAELPAGQPGERPLVIVLDNFAAGDQGLAEPHFAVLQKHWLDALVVPSTSNIRVVLGLNEEQLKEYNLETIPRGFKDVPLDYFPRDEFNDNVLDLIPLLFSLGANKDKVLNWLRKEIQSFDPEFDGRLSGRKLHEHCTFIWRICKAKEKEWANQ